MTTAIPALTRLIFLTASECELDVARSILSGVDITAAPPCTGEDQHCDPSDASRHQALTAFKQHQTSCFAIAESVIFDVESNSNRNVYLATDLARHGALSDLEGRPGLLRHALTFTPDGRSHVTFVSDTPGRILPPRVASKPLTIDDLWLPYGYARPLSSLLNTRTIHKRHRLLFELAGHLDLSTASDIYEVHLTVAPHGMPSLQTFTIACNDLGVKAIHIELPEGIVPSHLITSSFHRGSLERVREDAHVLAKQLEAFGLEVTRIKIEAMVRNSVVPCSDDDAANRPPGNYFEFHTKVAVRDGNELSVLRELCSRWDAHLSRNASNRLQGGVPLHFVTFRVARQGRDGALRAFDELLWSLRDRGFVTSNTLREYTVYDTNATLDDGWYPASG